MIILVKYRLSQLVKKKKEVEENINNIIDDIKFLNAVVEELEEELAVLNKQIDKCFLELYDL